MICDTICYKMSFDGNLDFQEAFIIKAESPKNVLFSISLFFVPYLKKSVLFFQQVFSLFYSLIINGAFLLFIRYFLLFAK